jgi:transcriptional regulator GlxA family with amidase domain
MARHVVFFVYPGFVLLDLSGPLEAFTAAEELAPGSYRLSVVSLDGGPTKSSAGLTVETKKATIRAIDTLVAVGNFALSEQAISAPTIKFLRNASRAARRTTSVCMGAFLLAACGLLDGRSATTHWRYAPKLQAEYPMINVDGDRIFTKDHGVWTSAGMTAAIDMVLALIEEDLGAAVSRAVARILVVYYRRPGGQFQYSSLLELDPESDRIRKALSYAREHLCEPLTVELLADFANLSVRQFSRSFVAATGASPAKAIERLRVEAAKPAVEDGREGFEVVAKRAGFGDAERMRQSFSRVLGQTPQELRRNSKRGIGALGSAARP